MEANKTLTHENEKLMRLKLKGKPEKLVIFKGWQSKEDAPGYFLIVEDDDMLRYINDFQIYKINGYRYKMGYRKGQAPSTEMNLDVDYSSIKTIQIEGSEHKWPVHKMSGRVSIMSEDFKGVLPKEYRHLLPEEFIKKALLDEKTIILVNKDNSSITLNSEELEGKIIA